MWSLPGRGRPRIGRPEAWAALLRGREHLVAGSGGVTLVEGGPGVGKSTFLAVLADESPAPRFQVAFAKATPAVDPPPFQLIGDALTALASGTKRIPPQLSTGVPSAPLAFQPAVERARARLSSMDPLGAMEEDAPSGRASDLLGLFGTLAEPLLVAAQQAPVVLILDDLHRADDASREFVAYLLPQLGATPIWVVASALPPPGPEGGRDRLKELRSNPAVERVTLAPLSEPEVSEFLQWALPEQGISAPESHRLFARSAGVPARIVQLLSPSAAAAPQEAAPLAPVAATGGGTSEPIDQLVLHLAMVAGPEIVVAEVAGAAGLPSSRTAAELDRWASKGLVQRLDEGRFAFVREEARDALLARLGPAAIRDYHRRLAESLLKAGAMTVGAVYALARHTYVGGLDAEAVVYNERAAKYAAAAYQPEVALRYLGIALDALGRSAPGDTRAELGLRLAMAVQQAHVGPPEAAQETLEEVRRTPRLWDSATPMDRTLFEVYRARVLADQGRWEEADRALQELPTVTHGWERGDLRRLAFRLQGEIQFYRGNYAEALEAHEAAVALATQEGDPREIAAEAIRRATVLSMIPGGDTEAVSEFRASIDRLLELGDTAEAALGALCLGTQLSALGRIDEARAALRQAIELSESSRDSRRSAWAHLNLADLELGVGQAAGARREVLEARRRFEEVEDSAGIARSSLTEGRLAMAKGDLGDAQRAFDTARTIFAGRHLDADELEVDLRLVQLAIARRDDADGRERLGRLMRAGLARLRPDLLEEARGLGRELGAPLSEGPGPMPSG